MGKVQGRILERLQQAGTFQSVHDLVYYVYEIEDGEPTRAQLVSVRRAIKQLTDCGMVESGMVSRQGYEGRLSCWLPNTLPPHCDPDTRCSGVDTEAAILKVLEGFDASKVEEWLRDAYYVRYSDRSAWANGYIPHAWLIKQTARIVGASYSGDCGTYVEPYFQVAFNRAIRRLVASGRLDGSIHNRFYSRGTRCDIRAPQAPSKAVAL